MRAPPAAGGECGATHRLATVVMCNMYTTYNMSPSRVRRHTPPAHPLSTAHRRSGLNCHGIATLLPSVRAIAPLPRTNARVISVFDLFACWVQCDEGWDVCERNRDTRTLVRVERGCARSSQSGCTQQHTRRGTQRSRGRIVSNIDSMYPIFNTT